MCCNGFKTIVRNIRKNNNNENNNDDSNNNININKD